MERITYKDLPVSRGDKIKLTVTMEVTAPQAYALISMFDTWDVYGQVGMSRDISFYVDGDGDFRPGCEITTTPALPKMPREQLKQAVIWENHGDLKFDYDPIAWSLDP